MFFTFQPVPAPPQPVFSINLEGRVSGCGSVAVRPGTSTEDTITGRVFVMKGGRGGLMIADSADLAITKSIGISCWVKLDSYPGYASQLVFRGDDRNGLDPFSLVIHDGKVFFGVQNEQDQGANVSAPMPLGQWVHVVGSLDHDRDAMRLYLDGHLVDAETTKIRPFAALDSNFSPGLGIGNVQHDRGPHNQPLQGSIADVRVYNVPITPTLVGFSEAGWKHPLFEGETKSRRGG